MLWKYKKCYAEVTDTPNIPCEYRHLVSVTASPNLNGGCSEINMSFLPKDYADPLEDIQYYFWNADNVGQIFNINLCIDINTLQYNCPNRVSFVWDDNIDCCQEKCYDYKAVVGSTPGTVSWIGCDGVNRGSSLQPGGTTQLIFCAKPLSVTTTGGVTVTLTDFTCP